MKGARGEKGGSPPKTPQRIWMGGGPMTVWDELKKKPSRDKQIGVRKGGEIKKPLATRAWRGGIINRKEQLKDEDHSFG